MPMEFEFFPEEYFQLSKEISRHPELVERINNHPANEFEIRLAEVASYLGIILDGDYMPEDLVRLAKIMTVKLADKRVAPSVIILN